MSKKAINRLKIVLVEQDRTNKWLAEKLNKNTLAILIIGILALACNNRQEATTLGKNQEVSRKNPADWRILECGLYINPKGEIGFPTKPDYVFKKHELKGENKLCPNRFITHLNDSIPLNTVIDTSSFIALGASFYKDKSSIYFHYSMCDGGYFNLFSNDTSNFKILNNCYVLCNNEILYSRGRKLEADLESFMYSIRFDQVAMDKDGYFQFGERITEEEIKKDMGDLFDELDLKHILP